MRLYFLTLCVTLLSLVYADQTAKPEKRCRVLITHSDVPQPGIELLKAKCDVIIAEGDPPTRKEILEKAKGVDGILWANHEPLNAEALDAIGSQVKAISAMSAGIDYIDIPEVKKRGIPLGFTPGILSDAVADTAIGLLISAGRRFHEGRLHIQNNTWEKRPQWLLGKDIKGSTVGIVGLGRIGSVIAKRLQGFEVASILYTGHSPKPYAEKLGATFVSLDDLLKKSDFVVVAAPLTNETRGMFNEITFKKMKPSSVFVNIARAEIVDQDVLVKLLKDGSIFAAGLDVTYPEPLNVDNPILQLPNCVVTPHLASATRFARDGIARIAAENVLRGLAGEPMVAPVP